MIGKWINLYNRKSNDLYDDREGYVTIVDKEKGFCQIKDDGQTLFVLRVCGDGLFWDTFIYDEALRRGCHRIRFGTQRDPKAFVRKFGYDVIGYILEKEVI